ncbi:WD40-repeat-containing domain protein, partial [Coemansia spiralis]
YKLSAVLSGHSSDVRGLAAQGSDVLISASQDGTGRIWKRVGPNEFAEDSILIGHKGYVRAVAVIPPTSDNPNEMVATGGDDYSICLWDPSDFSQPSSKLTGHTGNVCALSVSADGKTIVSGSWDGSAKVWVDGVCKRTLTINKLTVWAVLILEDGSVITASADKSISRWQNGIVTQTYSGHTDCVRALAPLSGGRFASAANDNTVRIWSLDGKCQSVLHGHTAFIYTLAVMPNGSIVSGGEDRTIRVWKDEELEHTIYVPSTSVWNVTALDNGDIACATSDGLVRVFTLDKTRLASESNASFFAGANSAFVMNKKTMGDYHPGMLLDPSRLDKSGDENEQVVLVKSGPVVEMYQWDQDSRKWNQVGLIADAAGQTQKKLFDGKEYDYVFDVDIQEGVPPLKLPFNVTENPYSAAQKFLEKNELNMEHLDTVANFIVKNADGVVLGSGEQSYEDPFTGGSRYVPNQPSGGTGSSSSGHGDPFTGGNRYMPSGSASSSYTPPNDYVISKQGNVGAIIKKLTEFNSQLAQDAAARPTLLSDSQIQLIQNLESVGTSSCNFTEDMHKALLYPALNWPKDKKFPALDLLRLVIAASPIPALTIVDGKDLIECIGSATDIFDVFGAGSTKPLAKSDEINLMMGVRALANSF